MKKIFIAVTIFSLLSANAQVTQRNLLMNKYTLADINQCIVPLGKFKPFPTTPEEWKQQVPDSILAKLIKDGDRGLKFKFNSVSFSTVLEYKKNGNRSMYEEQSFIKRTTLLQLTVAESVEGKGRFMDAIMEGLWSICEESYWGIPAHISNTKGIADVENPVVELFTGETAATLGLVNYFVGGKLDTVSPLLRKRLILEINKRFFKPLIAHFDEYNYLSKVDKVNNWNPWIMSNFIATNLLVENDDAKRSEILYYAMKGLDRYINSLGEDGGCDEGAKYWGAAGGCVFDCLEWAQKATNNKVNIFDAPLLKKMASYIYKMHIGGEYFVNIGDCEPTLKTLNGAFLYRFGNTIHDEQMKQFGLWDFANCEHHFGVSSFQRVRSVENLLTIKEMPPMTTPYKSPNHFWINDLQTMTARTDGNLFLGTHAGNNGKSHNHNDVGDFIIYLNDEPFIIDVGSGTYTAKTFGSHRYELWNNQSQYHNLPTINGIGEHDGVEYAAKNVVYTANEEADKLKMDIAGAYPKEAGIISWNRTNSLLRNKEEIEIMDEYEMKDKPTVLQQTFMTVADVDLSEKGKVVFTGKNDKLVLEYNATQFSVATDNPSVIGPDYGSISGKWDNKVITRVFFTAKNPQAKGKFEYRFIRKGE